jgi:hypothetical protein
MVLDTVVLLREGNTTQQLLKREESLREFAMRGEKVDQHW